MTEYLISNDSHHFKGLLGADRVDHHVAVDSNKVFRLQNAVLVLLRVQHPMPIVSMVSIESYLSRSINNLGSKVLALIPDDFAKGVLDGWVIALDEVAVYKLDGKRRLACSWY
jgi:hypothetical protein